MPDHYATLGVARSATEDEIKRAFRRLASQHHPDKGGDKTKFQEIQSAYDTLSNGESAYVFDELGLITYDPQGSYKLLTHVVFHPIQKSLNRLVQIDYTIRVQSLSGLIGA